MPSSTNAPSTTGKRSLMAVQRKDFGRAEPATNRARIPGIGGGLRLRKPNCFGKRACPVRRRRSMEFAISTILDLGEPELGPDANVARHRGTRLRFNRRLIDLPERKTSSMNTLPGDPFPILAPPRRVRPPSDNKNMAGAVRCPICQKTVGFDDPNMPFCSDRCRLIDLGNWAAEKYTVPASGGQPEDDEFAEIESPDPLEGRIGEPDARPRARNFFRLRIFPMGTRYHRIACRLGRCSAVAF